jgi:hypothetical protein
LINACSPILRRIKMVCSSDASLQGAYSCPQSRPHPTFYQSRESISLHFGACQDLLRSLRTCQTPLTKYTRQFRRKVEGEGGCGRHRDTLQDSDTQYLADQFTPLPSTALSSLRERRETVNGIGGGGVDRSYQGERKGNLQISQISRSRVKPLHQMLMLNRTTRQGAGYEQKRGR